MGAGPGLKRTAAICRKVLTALVHPYCCVGCRDTFVRILCRQLSDDERAWQ